MKGPGAHAFVAAARGGRLIPAHVQPKACTPMDAASAPQGPIFIVGCHRSGTTLLRLVLDSHPDVSCGPETRFLTELLAITGDKQWPHLQQYGLPRAWWQQRIAEFFGSVHGEYARRRGKR